jgi:hypothetical protein
MTALRDRLHPGQRWRRRRDGVVIQVRQIHRADRLVEVDLVTPQLFPSTRPTVGFRDLREHYEEVPEYVAA